MKFAVLAALVAVVTAIDPPKSAKKDLGDDAEAKAAEVMKDWYALITKTEQTAAAYDKADTKGKAKIDADIKLLVEGLKKSDTDVKVVALYSKMTTEQKTIYNAENIKFYKAHYKDCLASGVTAKNIDCKKGLDIRTAIEKYRTTKKYYAEKDPAKRKVIDDAQKAEVDKTRLSLSAAWIKANAPKANTAGFACTKLAKCTKIVAKAETLCCGTATRDTKAAASVPAAPSGTICNTKAATKYTDGLGNVYTYKCGAQHLLASAAAVLAVTYAM